jgi:cobalt-zinc-cadmium efflux system protein
MGSHPHHHPTLPGEEHGAELRALPGRRLLWALMLTATFLVVEVVAGLVARSLALLSDAGHMLTDSGALVLALYAQSLAARQRTGRRTFGYRRAEILAALVNGTVLTITAVAIIVEAVRRLRAPPEVLGGPMLAVAVGGLVVNLLAAWILARGGPMNVNVRAATAHVLSDAAGSAAAIIAALFVIGPGWTIADPIVSVVISILILIGGWRLVRESVDVLMEGVPANLDLKEIERVIRDTPGVAGVHDLHVWAISEGLPVVTVHVVLGADQHGTEVAQAVSDRVQSLAGIAHVTVQPEAPSPEHRLFPLRILHHPRGRPKP